MRAALIVIGLMFVSTLAFSATIYVPDNYATIQGAINASVNGDVVIVRAGTYVENIDFVGKAITVQSESGPNVTTIDGNQADSVVTFVSGEGADSILEGFTLTNGSGKTEADNYDHGGGVYCYGASPTIRHNIITGNYVNGPADGGVGAGIYCGGSAHPTITQNEFTANIAGYLVGFGGAICLKEGSNATISYNIITNNHSLGSGGGIMANGSAPTVIENQIYDNTTDSLGGGIYFLNCNGALLHKNLISGNLVTHYFASGGGGVGCLGSTVTITENTITGNEILRDFPPFGLGGGGILCRSASSPVIADNIIEYNIGGYGGGICCYIDSCPIISGNTIRFNTAEDTGGGISCYDNSDAQVIGNRITGNVADSDGGGLWLRESYVPVLQNIISENTGFYGGGIAVIYCSSRVVGNVIKSNTGTIVGGGIRLYESDTEILDNVIAGNICRDSGGGLDVGSNCSPVVANNYFIGNSTEEGGGISCQFDSFPVFTNNTVAYNTASEAGGGIYAKWSTSPVFYNTIVWGNDAPEGPQIWLGDTPSPATLTISYSDVQGGLAGVHVDSGCTLHWGSGMIDADPLFVEQGVHDYHLTWNSPCRNTGDNASVSPNITEDFEADPRIALGTVDMGADEYYYHLYHMGDVIPGSPIDVKVVGYPTAPIVLYLGSGIADPPYSTQHGDFYLNWPPLWQGAIGTLPGNGILTISPTVPTSWTPGSEHPLQALVGPWGGVYTLLTNPMILSVE